MKKIVRYSQKLVLLSICLAANSSFSQVAVPVGKGSYASFTPASENTSAFENRVLNVPVNNTEAIPTNDWWTSVIFENFAGNLHAYPITINPENYGCQLIFPTQWAGQDMLKDFPITIKGVGFTPLKNIAKSWSDWSLQVNMQDNAKSMDITLGNGFPMAWFEINGFEPYLEFGTGTSFFKLDGSSISFPFNGSEVGVTYGGKKYGIYAPNNTQFTLSGSTLTIKNPSGKSYFTVAALKQNSDLAYVSTFAYSIPRDTKVSWIYSPELAKIDVTYTVATENLKGASEKRVLQGFIPHHYKNCIKNFDFNGRDYACPRGLLKCAEGNSFTFTYPFNGVLAHYPAPAVQPALPNPYDPVKMKSLIDAFSTVNNTRTDTYWGSKDLLNFPKTALMAKELGNSNADAFRIKSRNSLINWLTYTPGETDSYFARYTRHKALVGFNPSYGSQEFTDQHFHYGYLTLAGALQGMIDKPFLDDYGPMLKLVAKAYANWDRTDKDYPFMRTFSPWRGHSYAGGKSAGDGNNQESTSEAMQSWAGVFLLGDLLGDTQMRDAGAFGYLTESRATREYWFDVDNENLPPSYTRSMVGILFDGGVSYGTWFSGDPIHIHGIQWLPWSPVMNYMAAYPAYLKADYETMKNAQQAKYPTQTEDFAYGSDWANVSLCHQQMFDPDAVALKMDQYYASAAGTPRKNVMNYVNASHTYYYTHAHRTLGSIQQNMYTTAPISQVYFNTVTNKYTFVGYNSKSTEQTINVYKSGALEGTIKVPALSFFNTQTLVKNPTTVDESFSENFVQVFPNPSSGGVFNLSQSLDWKVISVIGEVLKSGNGNEIDMSEYPKGIYLIAINDYTEKIIIE